MEIERKFLIKNIPFTLSDFPSIDIEQAYISTSPVIRIRKKNLFPAGATTPDTEEYVLTVKSKGLMSREEFELNLEAFDYEKLLEKAEGNVLSKRRYLIPLKDNYTLELDVFEGIYKGLIIGEIEFPNEDIANKYNPPEYLSREVTFDNRFHNSSLSSMSGDEALNLVALLH